MAELSTTYEARSLSFSPEATPLLRAAAAEPPDKEALISLGYLSLKRVIYPGALKYFDRALKLDPGNKAASDGRAAALFRMGLGQEALEELKRGRALHGDSPDLYYNIAMIEYLSGDAAGAIKDLSRFLKFREITPAFRAQALALRAAHGRATGMGLQSVRH
jgi:Flp pilus assembly protein TadD